MSEDKLIAELEERIKQVEQRVEELIERLVLAKKQIEYLLARHRAGL